jgi:hypothetical protein
METMHFITAAGPNLYLASDTSGRWKDCGSKIPLFYTGSVWESALNEILVDRWASRGGSRREAVDGMTSCKTVLLRFQYNQYGTITFCMGKNAIGRGLTIKDMYWQNGEATDQYTFDEKNHRKKGFELFHSQKTPRCRLNS